jgi:hypothetical protein
MIVAVFEGCWVGWVLVGCSFVGLGLVGSGVGCGFFVGCV